jgi:hypothetical protein
VLESEDIDGIYDESEGIVEVVMSDELLELVQTIIMI